MTSSRIPHITVIDPVTWDTSALPLPRVTGTRITRVNLPYGTTSVESRLDDALAVPGILDRAVRTEADGADAIVINCMDDPGVAAARELVRIPVVGPAHASMQLALTLAHRFSIVTTSETDVPVVEELIDAAGLSHRAAPVLTLGRRVSELEDDPRATVDAFHTAARTALTEHRSAALIAGCTLLSPHISALRTLLQADGYSIPLIDPLQAALHLARSLVRQGLSHSEAAYAPPADKPLTWFTALAREGGEHASARH